MLGHNHKMNMIGHKAVRPYIATGLEFRLGNQGKVHCVISFIEESILPAITTLSDMMRVAWNDQSRHSGHNKSRLRKNIL
jgi:hypothetical protein